MRVAAKEWRPLKKTESRKAKDCTCMSQTRDTRARSSPGARAIWGCASPMRRVTPRFSLELNAGSPLGRTQIHLGPIQKQERSLHLCARLKHSMAGPFQRKHARNRRTAAISLQCSAVKSLQCNCRACNFDATPRKIGAQGRACALCGYVYLRRYISGRRREWQS